LLLLTIDRLSSAGSSGISRLLRSLTIITFVSPSENSATELTDRFISRDAHKERLALKICPHWRSVFSSVFKEPKLMAHPRGDHNVNLRGLVPASFRLRNASVGRETKLARSLASRNPCVKKLPRRGGAASCRAGAGDTYHAAGFAR
jgi:hypothetical protein